MSESNAPVFDWGVGGLECLTATVESQNQELAMQKD